MSNSFGIAICKMIGIDPNTVKAIQINCDSDGISTADVTFSLINYKNGCFDEVTKRFDLIEIPDANG